MKLQGAPVEIFRSIDVLREISLGVPPVVELAEELRSRGMDVPGDIIEEEQLVRFLCQ